MKLSDTPGVGLQEGDHTVRHVTRNLHGHSTIGKTSEATVTLLGFRRIGIELGRSSRSCTSKRTNQKANIALTLKRIHKHHIRLFTRTIHLKGDGRSKKLINTLLNTSKRKTCASTAGSGSRRCRNCKEPRNSLAPKNWSLTSGCNSRDRSSISSITSYTKVRGVRHVVKDSRHLVIKHKRNRASRSESTVNSPRWVKQNSDRAVARVICRCPRHRPRVVN